MTGNTDPPDTPTAERFVEQLRHHARRILARGHLDYVEWNVGDSLLEDPHPYRYAQHHVDDVVRARVNARLRTEGIRPTTDTETQP